MLSEELQRLELLTFENVSKQLEKVRDMFLFACYTGLRYSDVSGLTINHFNETEKGLRLNKAAQKTSKILDLPLGLLFGGKPENLIRKYWSDNPKTKLFGFTNQFVNRELKTLSKQAGIKKHLTFHVARHTAATILSKKVGVWETKNLLQHSKLETTNQYLHSSQIELDRSLSEVTNWY
ncbi:MAG: site-specific integrase [Spirosomataceae bacterium]